MSEKGKIYFYPFLAALIASFVVYGFELTHFTLSIDEEFMDTFNHTVGLGRWGHSFLREYILPEPFAPFFTTLISLVIFSCAASLTARLADIDVEWSCFMAVLYVSIPQFAYQLEFSNQSDTVALAITAATISVLLFTKNGAKLFSWGSVISVFLYTFSISVYQAFSVLPITLCFVYLIFALKNDKINKTQSVIFLMKFAVISIFSVALYLIATALVQKTLGITGGSYLSNMIKWGSDDYRLILKSVILSISGYFTFNTFYGLGIYSVSVIAFVLFLISIVLRKQFNIYLIIMFVMLLLTPFIMTAALGGGIQPRIMTSLSPAFSAAIVIALMSISLRWLNYSCVASLLLIGSANSNRLFYADYISRQNDSLLANRIISSIYSSNPDFNEKTTPVYFYGKEDPVNPWKVNGDIFGRSFFEQDGGNNGRIVAFMKTSGIANLIRANESMVATARKDAEKMPEWPNPNSIQMHNGVLIIKLGNTPGVD